MYNDVMKRFEITYKNSLCFVLVLFTLFGVGAVSAAPIKIGEVKELKPVEFLSKEEFEEKTRYVEALPNDDSHLAYKMRVPKEWGGNTAIANITIDDGSVTEKVLGVVVRHVSPPHPEHARNFFTLESVELKYEIGLKNWFIHYATLNGLSLEYLTEKNARELEAIFVEVKKDTTYIVRTKIMINGSKMIVAKYYVSQKEYEAEKALQAQVIDSFELLSLDKTSIEKVETFSFLGQSYFDRPLTWSFNPPVIRSIDFVKAKVYRSSLWGKLQGKIDVQITNKLSVESFTDVVKKYREDFEIAGYKIGGLINSPKLVYSKDVSAGSTEVYKLIPNAANQIEYELWVSVMEGSDYYYLTALVTPSRDQEFYEWARNAATYKLVTKSVRRRGGQKNYLKYLK